MARAVRGLKRADFFKPHYPVVMVVVDCCCVISSSSPTFECYHMRTTIGIS